MQRTKESEIKEKNNIVNNENENKKKEEKPKEVKNVLNIINQINNKNNLTENKNDKEEKKPIENSNFKASLSVFSKPKLENKESEKKNNLELESQKKIEEFKILNEEANKKYLIAFRQYSDYMKSVNLFKQNFDKIATKKFEYDRIISHYTNIINEIDNPILQKTEENKKKTILLKKKTKIIKKKKSQKK